MSFDVHTFRERYRAAISPGYNPWLHAGFVALFGLGVAVWVLVGAFAELWTRSRFLEAGLSVGFRRLAGLPRSAFGTTAWMRAENCARRRGACSSHPDSHCRSRNFTESTLRP